MIYYRTMGQAGLGKIKKFPQRYTALYEFLLTNTDERWLHTLRLIGTMLLFLATPAYRQHWFIG